MGLLLSRGTGARGSPYLIHTQPTIPWAHTGTLVLTALYCTLHAPSI